MCMTLGRAEPAQEKGHAVARTRDAEMLFSRVQLRPGAPTCLDGVRTHALVIGRSATPARLGVHEAVSFLATCFLRTRLVYNRSISYSALRRMSTSSE